MSSLSVRAMSDRLARALARAEPLRADVEHDPWLVAQVDRAIRFIVDASHELDELPELTSDLAPLRVLAMFAEADEILDSVTADVQSRRDERVAFPTRLPTRSTTDHTDASVPAVGGQPVLEYMIEPREGAVRINVAGVSTPDEVLALYERLMNDPDFRPGAGLLVDRRGVEAPPTAESVYAFVEHMVRFGVLMGRPRVAIVVHPGLTSAPWDWVGSLTHHYAGSELRVFEEIDSANGWLRESNQ